jgi:para-nitrobenzyl esterase
MGTKFLSKMFSFYLPAILVILVGGLLFILNRTTVVGWTLALILCCVAFLARVLYFSWRWYLKLLSWAVVMGVLFAVGTFARPIERFKPAVSLENARATAPIQSKNGLVTGVYNSDKSVAVFAGIPYAAPPVGELRWKPPQPVVSWTGIRKADHFSANAIQMRTPALVFKFIGLPFTQEFLVDLDEPFSEDCLYLNIWTDARALDEGRQEPRPVLVYLHGGGFTIGSGSIPIYDGEEMAKKGVVMVTLNYRLGVLGFLATAELTRESARDASGNYGLMDQIAAIAWVKDNIAAFGGDPQNITVAGQSAGSMSLNILTASPLAKDLFQRGIAESGARFNASISGDNGRKTRTRAEAEAVGATFLARKNVSSIEELRKLPIDKLQSFADLVWANQNDGPIVDGYVLPDSVDHIYAEGKQNDVPVLGGSNANEGSLMTSTLSPKEYVAASKRLYGSKAGSYLKLFPASTKEEARASQIRTFTVKEMGWPMQTWARLQSKTGKTSFYLYYFDRVPSGSKYGAFHTAEVPYAYGNLKAFNIDREDLDVKLSSKMASYWANFVKTGDPNGPGLPVWLDYRTAPGQALELGNSVGMIPLPDQAAYEFFDGVSTGIEGN